MGSNRKKEYGGFADTPLRFQRTLENPLSSVTETECIPNLNEQAPLPCLKLCSMKTMRTNKCLAMVLRLLLH